MGRAATANWYNFVNHHKPFIALSEMRELKILEQKKSKLTKPQTSLLRELTKKKNSKEWLYADGNHQLEETYERVNNELSIVSFMHIQRNSKVKRRRFR